MKTSLFFAKISLASALGLIVGSSYGGTIIQDQGASTATIAFYDPIGQSFIAEETQLSTIAFAFGDANPGLFNSPITMTLYLGSGFDGPVLDSVTQTLPPILPEDPDAPQFIDFDFSGNFLVVGATYTAAVTTSSFKVEVALGGDAYANGRLFAASEVLPDSGFSNSELDLNFRVVSVPEPATWALLSGSGLWMLLVLRKRRNTSPSLAKQARAYSP